MKRLNSDGLTIVELLVVVIVSGLLMGVIIPFALNYWQKASLLEASQESLVSRLNSGDYLRDAIDASSGLITQNDINDNNVAKVDPSDSTMKHWLPIHAVPTTIAVGSSGTFTPVIYFNRPSINTSKNIVLNGSIPYEDNTVLYLNGTTKQLLARVLANPSAPSNRARTSCPSAAATNSCPADAVVAENVTSVTMRYFSRSGNLIDYTSVVDPVSGSYIGPDFPSVEVVEFTVKYYVKSQVKSRTNSQTQTVIRIALRNN